jgi:hypothetical protein
MPKAVLSPDRRTELLTILQTRFDKNRNRHPNLEWVMVLAALEAHPEKLWALHEMERTGGEPDVVGRDAQTGEFVFVDCSPESPVGRRSVCYDQAGQDARKDDAPAKGNAVGAAAAMGVELLSEEEYADLQKLGEFDVKTSSWLKTPPELRKLGGAIFGDRRYGRVFVYHNGAQSFYGARGFRGVLRV